MPFVQQQRPPSLTLVSARRCFCAMEATERRGRWPSAPALGDVARPPSGYNRGRARDLRHRHARPNSRWIPIVRTRQVTVTQIVCGVDVSKRRLDAHVAPSGAFESFDNDAAGIAALADFCRRQGVQARRDGGDRRLRTPGLPAAVAGRHRLRSDQPQKRAALRRGHGHPGEDRPARCRCHRPLRHRQGAEADEPADTGPTAPQCPGGAAAPGHRRPHGPEAAAQQRHERGDGDAASTR